MEYNSQILENSKYINICQKFIDLAQDEITKTKLESILYNGCMGNYTVGSGLRCRNNPHIETTRRLSMAYLLLNNPETFDYLCQNNINVFHGTNINALPSIAKCGIGSVDYLNDNNVSIVSGEKWSRLNGNRSFISFTDVLDLSEMYASIDKNKNMTFEVIVGTTSDDIRKYETVVVNSDLPEIAINNHFNLGNIKCLCVPNDKIEFVEKIINNPNIKVLGLSNLDNKFYYFDEITNYFNLDVYEEFKKINNEKNKKRISKDDLIKFTRSRNIFDINKIAYIVKKKFSKDNVCIDENSEELNGRIKL